MKLLDLTPANQHVTRAYNSLHLDKKRGILFKISKDARLRQEINYYQSLDTNSSNFFPRFLGSEISSDGSYIMKLEYYGYDNLGDYMVYNTFDPHF